MLFQPQTKVVFLCFFQPQKWVESVFTSRNTGSPLVLFKPHVLLFLVLFQRRSSAFSTTKKGGQALFQQQTMAIKRFFNRKLTCSFTFITTNSAILCFFQSQAKGGQVFLEGGGALMPVCLVMSLSHGTTIHVSCGYLVPFQPQTYLETMVLF